MEKVEALRPVSYRWKVDGSNGSLQYGFIAQELEKQFPELVREGEDGYKQVNMGALMPYVVSAIKEQQKELDNLKATGGATLAGGVSTAPSNDLKTVAFLKGVATTLGLMVIGLSIVIALLYRKHRYPGRLAQDSMSARTD